MKRFRSFLFHWKAATRDFKGVASFFPSSKTSVRNLSKEVTDRSKLIIEYGAGTGVLTRELLKKAPPFSKLIAVEKNKVFLDLLKKNQDPRLELLEESLPECLTHLNKKYFNSVDLIFSGIPFSLIEPANQQLIIKESYELLNQEGKIIIYQNSKLVLPLLKKYFSKVEVRFELFNVFPYFVMQATKK